LHSSGEIVKVYNRNIDQDTQAHLKEYFVEESECKVVGPRLVLLSEKSAMGEARFGAQVVFYSKSNPDEQDECAHE